MKIYKKKNFPVIDAHRVLEPSPIVLLSSHWKGQSNIMTLGWYTVMEFTPSLVGCVISQANHSFAMIRKSGECVINIPTADMVDAVTAIGNCSGDKIDKFEATGLTQAKAAKVKAPLIAECFASFECRVADSRLVHRYNFFIFEIVKAHVAPSPKYPQTLHYHGQGIFTTDRKIINRSAKFTKWNQTAIF